MGFGLASCKKSSPAQNPSQIEENEQPGGGGQENPEPPVDEVRYNVSFDYDLPEFLEGVVSNYVASNRLVGVPTMLPTIDASLERFFLGWYEGDNLVEGNSVSSQTERTINLVAHWDTQELNDCYYTTGIEFEQNVDEISVTGFNGTNKKIFIPKYYYVGDTKYAVTEIASESFKNSNVEEIVLNCDEIVVEDSAFMDSKLKSIDFSKITSIGNSAFEGTDLTEVSISDEVVEIGSRAFANCESLVEIDFDNAVVCVSESMFEGCVSLASITSTDGFTEIESAAFKGCEALTNTNFLHDGLISIGNNAFEDCVGLLSVKIPKTVTSISNSAFSGCENVTALEMSRLYNTSTDGTDRFSNHFAGISENLTTIVIADDIISRIYGYYFSGLTNLEEFVMPNSVMYVEDYVFSGCTKLENITLSTEIDPDSFTWRALYDTKYLTLITEPIILSNVLVYAPVNIAADYQIPSGITKISDSAFVFAENLERITIPSSVSSIGEFAFDGCEKLEEVVFAENSNIEILKTGTFCNCTGLETINLTSLTGLTEIQGSAFARTNISSFVLPNTVTTIADSAFFNANIAAFSIDGVADKFVAVDGVLYYVDGADYIIKSYPKQKQGEVFIVPSQVNGLAEYAFYANQYLEHIYLSSDIQSLDLGISTYNIFASTRYIVNIFVEDQSLEINAPFVLVYHLLESGYTYDEEASPVLQFEEEFVAPYSFLFIKLFDDVTQKYTIAYFKLDDSNNIIRNEIFKVEENF